MRTNCQQSICWLCMGVSLIITSPLMGQLVITEVMSSSSHPGTDPLGFGGLANGDWFELFNAGSNPVDMTGYLWDDDNRLSNPNGITQFPDNFVIQPQEIVLFVQEDLIAIDLPGGFRESWNIPMSTRIFARDQMLGTDTFSGLSSNGDEINIYNAQRQLVASVTFPAATRGFSFEWDQAGNYLGVSQIGVHGAYQALADGSEMPPPYPFLDVASPGIAVGLPGITGDFNNDGLYNCVDIDALVGVIAGGTNNPAYDLTADGFVNLADRDAWLSEAGGVNLGPGRAYRLGDANLDGVVDGSDFGTWNANKFTSVAAWCKADFNADGLVDGSDFGAWNANKFTSSDGTVVVPEASIASVLLVAALSAISARRKR